MTTNAISPIHLDLQLLPKHYRENWNIITAVRSHAQLQYALKIANTQADPKTEEGAWCTAFTKASLDWLEVNPLEEFWSTGAWPEGAADFLGNDAYSEALKLVGF